MPANIGVYGWTVPEGTDAPAGPEQFTELANDIATTVKSIDNRVVVLETPQLVRCRRTAALSITSTSTPQGMQFNLKDEDPQTMSDVNGYAFTVKKAGVWYVSAGVVWSPNAVGARWMSIHVNGTVATSVTNQALTTASWHHGMHVSANLRLVVNDIVTVGVAQVSGAALDTSASYPSLFSMIWRRP